MSKLESIQGRIGALERFIEQMPRLKTADPLQHVDDRQMEYYQDFVRLRAKFIVDALVIAEMQRARDVSKINAVEELLRGNE
jgi:hypothetical protein